MERGLEVPVVLESAPLRPSKEFESRRLIEEKIIEALKKDSISTIGICGVGGIGKTRMARRIGEKVKEEKLFKFVVMVRVGPRFDRNRILYEISDYLGVRNEVGDFVSAADELFSRLFMEKRILIILDDVRQNLDLGEFGVLLRKHMRSCKIMITSQFESVCLEIGAQEIFRMECLTEEEMWILLREKAGIAIDSSDIFPLARFAAEKCRGLPLAINLAGRVLKHTRKIWPGIVATAILGKALLYEFLPGQVMAPQASAFVGKTVKLSTLRSLPRIPDIDINLWPEKYLQSSNISILNRVVSKNRKGSLSASQYSFLTDNLSPAVKFQKLQVIDNLSPVVKFRKLIDNLSPAVKFRKLQVIDNLPRALKLRKLQVLRIPNIDIQVFPEATENLKYLRSLAIAGNGSKYAVDYMNLESFKFLKRLEIRYCTTMEYLVNQMGKVVPTNYSFPVLESLCLEDLPHFKAISHSQHPVGLFGELRYLKLRRLPALLHVFSSPPQNDSLSNLTSVRISHCPKIKSLFPISMAQKLMRLKEIKIEYCEMMGEIFSEETCGDGKISKKIEFPNITHLKLDTLPNLIGFCKNTGIEFPQLRVMRIQSLRMLRSFCPSESDLSFEGIDDSAVQFLFNEKVVFGSLKILEIVELDNVTSIWGHGPSTNLFNELQVLVVRSCGNLRNLFSHSVAEAFVQLKHLIIEECPMMQEVIAEDGEAGQQGNNVSPFPQLEILELRRLPMLNHFCHMINDLELPSLEALTIYDCPGMKEFSCGRVNMPFLKCVKKDHSVYRINSVNYTVERLLNEKYLFVHQPWFLCNQNYGATEEEFVEEDVMTGLNRSPPETICQATGGNSCVNLQEQGFCSTSKNTTMTEDHVNINELPGEEIRHEIESEVPTNMLSRNKENVEGCILFCSIFPSDYSFAKDMLVWQWIAEGLIRPEEEETLEEACIQCFDTLLNLDYIVPSGYDHDLDHMKYKFADKMKEFLRNHMMEASKFRKFLDSKETDATKLEHLSLAFEKIDDIDFSILKRCRRLHTLMIHHCYGTEVKCLPSDIFAELKALKILNLSHTVIEELPSSIEKLEELRFLDVSETPIGWLPESICCLSTLQTLNLDGCSGLIDLPKCMSKLVNLHHLFLDVVSQLQSMPPGIGKLSKLQTLNGFLVGNDDGSRIVELKYMNQLKGSLRVLYLENVMTKEDAEGARLCDKHNLKKIEMQWSDLQDERNPDEDEILECLQPPFGVQELKIFFYSGGMLPSWISNPSFSELVSITLFGCRYWESLPPLGELPSLKRLNIVENDEVTEINSYFCRQIETYQHHRAAFPKLEKLSFRSMSKLETWTGVKDGDFPCLRQLIVEYCPQLVLLPSLSHLSSLLHMEISYCPELSCLLEGELPTTLESLMINDCPKLKERCQNEHCEDWSKVAHVPKFYIDNQKVLV